MFTLFSETPEWGGKRNGDLETRVWRWSERDTNAHKINNVGHGSSGQDGSQLQVGSH